MAVGVQCYPDIGVSQSLRDNLGVYPVLQHQRGVNVAEIMKPEVGHPCLGGRLAEGMGDTAGVERAAVGVTEDEVIIAGDTAKDRSFNHLFATVTSQLKGERWRESHPPATSGGLWLLSDGSPVVESVQAMADVDAGQVEVNVFPLQGKQLTPSQTGVEQREVVLAVAGVT